jgi:dynamin 1-like protein
MSKIELSCELKQAMIHHVPRYVPQFLNIVRQSIQDIVPKGIMHFLVNHTAQRIQNRLIASLCKPDLFASMLNELVAERKRVKALLDAYKEAFKTLSDVSLKST